MPRRIRSSRGFLASIVLVLVSTLVAGSAVSGQPGIPTPTAAPAMGWTGRVVSEVEDLSLRGSVVRVSVVGIKGLPVKIVDLSGSWSTIGLTGSKPEFGEYVVEFAPVARGYFRIEPQGLNTSLTIYSDTKTYINVEFTRGPIVLPTATPSTTPVIIVPGATPSPFTATPVSPQPTATPTPTATAPPPTTTPTSPPTAFAPVALSVPQTVTIWTGRVAYTTEGDPFGYGAVAVRVIGRSGLPVEIKAGGFQAVCITGTKPEHGSSACEFGGLAAGRYVVQPQGIDTSVTVDVERGSLTLVEFRSLTVTVTPPAPQFYTFVPVTTPTPDLLADASRVFPPISPVLSQTVPLTWPTPPKPAWTGQVTQYIPGTQTSLLAATMVVRVLGARDLPIILDSGGWEARAYTGSKPEYGEFAAEFGGLAPGEYDIIPDGLDLRYKVNVGQGDFFLIDFTYTLPETPTIQHVGLPPLPPIGETDTWSGRVVSQTATLEGATEFGGIIVQVMGVHTLPIEVRSADHWSVFILAQAEPEAGAAVARFTRLSPGRYQIMPQGLGTWIELHVHGGTWTWVEFAPGRF